MQRLLTVDDDVSAGIFDIVDIAISHDEETAVGGKHNNTSGVPGIRWE